MNTTTDKPSDILEAIKRAEEQMNKPPVEVIVVTEHVADQLRKHTAKAADRQDGLLGTPDCLMGIPVHIEPTPEEAFRTAKRLEDCGTRVALVVFGGGG